VLTGSLGLTETMCRETVRVKRPKDFFKCIFFIGNQSFVYRKLFRSKFERSNFSVAVFSAKDEIMNMFHPNMPRVGGVCVTYFRLVRVELYESQQ
jgi:hypothetical protein